MSWRCGKNNLVLEYLNMSNYIEKLVTADQSKLYLDTRTNDTTADNRPAKGVVGFISESTGRSNQLLQIKLIIG
jgi:hypothetical protein